MCGGGRRTLVRITLDANLFLVDCSNEGNEDILNLITVQDVLSRASFSPKDVIPCGKIHCLSSVSVPHVTKILEMQAAELLTLTVYIVFVSWHHKCLFESELWKRLISSTLLHINTVSR